MLNSSPLPFGWQLVRLAELEAAGALTMRNGFPCGNNNDQGRGIPQLRPMNIDESGEISLVA